MAESFEVLAGVGPKRAASLREAGYTSIEELVRAGPDPLVAIDGIGDATATDIVASAVTYLDSSAPTVDTAPTPEIRTLSTAFEPMTYTPKLYQPVRVQVDDTASPVAPTADAERAAATQSETTVADDTAPPANRADSAQRTASASHDAQDATTLALAGLVLSQDADETGRIGRERLHPSDFDANLTVTLAPEEQFAERGATLDDSSLGTQAIKTLRALEKPLLAWAGADPANATHLFLDPADALTQVEATAVDVETQALAPLFDAGHATSTLSPVGIRSLRIAVREEVE